MSRWYLIVIFAVGITPVNARHLHRHHPRVVIPGMRTPVVQCKPYGDGTMCGVPGGLPPQYFTDPTIPTRNWAGGDGSGG